MDNKHMLYGMPPTGLMAVPSRGVGIVEALPPLDTLEAMLEAEPAVEPAPRRLIALVGMNGTGKHTYLRNYYLSVGIPHYKVYGRFIEEPGMHPADQREYMQKVKGRDNTALATEYGLVLPNPYMFVTYSPYIVDEMGSPEDVICFHRSRGGRYYRAPLSSHPDIGWGMQTLTLGEFWDSVGEEWLEEHGEDVTLPEC